MDFSIYSKRELMVILSLLDSACLHFGSFDAGAQNQWQLYSYLGPFKKTETLYAVNVSDLVDPPRHGWFTVKGESPVPSVLVDTNPHASYQCNHTANHAGRMGELDGVHA